MGKQVKVSQIQIQFGPSPGTDVQIKMSNSPAPPSPAAAAALPTVARAAGIGGSYTFRIKKPIARRDIVIWFTRLPPMPGTGNRYQATVSANPSSNEISGLQPSAPSRLQERP